MKFTAQQAVNYFQKYFSVYEALHGLRVPINEEGLLSLIQQHAPPSDSSNCRGILDKSLDFGFIDTLKTTTSTTYELFDTVRFFIDHISHSQTQVTSELIAGYLKQLDLYVERLESTLENNDEESAIITIRSVDAVIDRIRSDSRNSCQAVLSESVRIKSSLESTSLRERYTLVNHLWDYHVAPLQEVIDINAAIDASLGRLSTVLGQLDRHFRHVSVVNTHILTSQSKLRRMREETFNVYREAKSAIEPLYKKVKRDGLIAVGAARILSILEEGGGKVLSEQLNNAFLSNSRNEAMFEDMDAAVFMGQISDYNPDKELILQGPEEGSSKRALSLQDVLASVYEQAHIDDLATFVEQTFSDADSRYFFDAVCTLSGSAACELTLSDSPVEFDFHNERWRGHAISLDIPNEQKKGV